MTASKQVTRLAVAAAVAWCLLSTPARAQDCPQQVGRSPYGPAYAVAVSDDYAYLGSGAALIVVDVSVPSSPLVAGWVVLPDVVQDVVFSSGHAYVADGSAGLRVVDVSDPFAPVEVAFVDTPGHAIGVAVAGNHAYVADDYAGLRVIDVSAPSAPVEVGSVDLPDEAVGVAVSGGHAYVAGWEAGLRVVDVTTPTAPVEVGSVDTPNYASAVAVAGGFAYVADGVSGLRVIDVSNPSAPREVGSVDTPGFAYGVAVSGDSAYVADWEAGLRVIDVGVPAFPAELGSITTTGPAWSVATAGTVAFVAAQGGGLRIVDVSAPSAPDEVGFVDTPGYASAVAVSGGHAFIVDDGSGLRVVDVRSPSAPMDVGYVNTPSYATAVAAAGGYAYVVTDDAGLRVIDARNPAAPVEVGSLELPGQPLGIALSAGYAYVAAAAAGLRVIDISRPSAPVEAGFIEPPGYAFDVAVAGEFAYVGYADYDAGVAGLRVIDVFTPSDPVQVGVVDLPGTATDVAVADRTVFVAAEAGGLRIVDVSTPSEPAEVGFLLPPGGAYAVAVSRGYAYVAAGEGGLRAVDVGTPSAPVEAGAFDPPEWTEDVAVFGGHVYATGGDAGFAAFRDCAGGVFPDGLASFIPAAAIAAGAQGAFFSTDLEINNTGPDEAQLYLQWLPRGEDNSAPVSSDLFTLGPGGSLRWENVLTELFGLGPDSVGALKLLASTGSVIGMSRTYNSPEGKAAGTFGQGLPAIRVTDMTAGTEPRRIIFLSEDDDSRANVGCVNGASEPVRISIGVFDDEGSALETRTMSLGPYSNNQINRIFRSYAPVNGYVDVSADSDDAIYYCYGSMLDNLTSDPTTILPQVPSDDITFIPAAALAAGLEGSFFQTDLDLNNAGSTDITYELLWLPRGADNSSPVRSDAFSLAPGAGVRYADVLGELFGLEPDQVGALAIEASGADLLAMSRTYNLPSAKVAGTFGQELPGIPADRMVPSGVKRRIIFMNESADVRSNVGCQNGGDQPVTVSIQLFNAEGEALETKAMNLAPYSNNQITRVFRDHSPISAGYVDVWTTTPGASIYCYGSVLDNETSDPTTVLPQ
jgi:hypothetical protein